MKAKELRIGNYVKDPYNKEIRLVSVEKDASMLRPIPLTEERLLKFKFKLTKKTEQRNYYNYNDKIDFVIDKELGFTYLVISGVNIPCKFVHQFQNIIYELTGEEIEL